MKMAVKVIIIAVFFASIINIAPAREGRLGKSFDSAVSDGSLTAAETDPDYASDKAGTADMNVIEANSVKIDGNDLLVFKRGKLGTFTGDKTVAHGLGADPNENVIVQTRDLAAKLKVVFSDSVNITFRALDCNDANTSVTNGCWIAWRDDE